MESKISVIIPVYNVEKYLSRCIKSVIDQVYSNLEIILVDDGSTDLSGKICDEWADKDSRIIVIHKKNGGLSDARNTGIDYSSGELLVFIDSDDYITPDMIEKLYVALNNNSADMSVCNFLCVDEKGNPSNFLSERKLVSNEVISGKEVLSFICDSFEVCYTISWNKLYKKSLFNDVRFPKGKVHEDEFVIHHLLKNCSFIACISDCCYYYVQRQGSIMNSRNMMEQLNIVDAFLDRAIFCNTIGLHVESGKMFKKCTSKLYDLYIDILSSNESNQYFHYLFRKIQNHLSLFSYCSPKVSTEILLFYIHPQLKKFWLKIAKKTYTLKRKLASLKKRKYQNK